MSLEPSSLHLWMPLAFSIAVWWLSTGIILRLVDGTGPARETRALVLASLALGLGLTGVVLTRDLTTPVGAYMAFVSALLVWSWQEITFLVGLVTGPNRQPCPEVKGWTRAWQAFRAIAHHEAALVLLGAAVILPSWDAPNSVASQTFLVLWAMRLSAKLNLFLGVKNFYESFLPPSLHYLLTYFSRRSFNLFFPISLGLATFVAVFFWEQAWLGESAYEIAASSLVASLLALAILEHLLLVLPIRPERLWRWALAREGG
jgi:putative photosynthetic complex assembly protein 2